MFMAFLSPPLRSPQAGRTQYQTETPALDPPPPTPASRVRGRELAPGCGAREGAGPLHPPNMHTLSCKSKDRNERNEARAFRRIPPAGCTSCRRCPWVRLRRISPPGGNKSRQQQSLRSRHGFTLFHLFLQTTPRWGGVPCESRSADPLPPGPVAFSLPPPAAHQALLFLDPCPEPCRPPTWVGALAPPWLHHLSLLDTSSQRDLPPGGPPAPRGPVHSSLPVAPGG